MRRTTSSGSYIPEIDGLRFISITAIFVYHLNGFLTLESGRTWVVGGAQDVLARLLFYGFYAVHLFFTISGFVLGLPFAIQHVQGGHSVSLRHYYLRRLTRIEPPYFVMLLLFFSLLVLFKFYTVTALLPSLLAGFVYLHNIVFGQPNLINGVAWTLEIEVQFYLIAPLLARLFKIPSRFWRRAIFLGLMYLAMGLQWLLEPQTVLNVSGINLWGLNLTLFNFIQYFLAGFLLADIYVHDWHQTPQSAARGDAVIIGLCLALPYVWQAPVLSHFIFPAIMFTLYAALFRSRFIRWLLTRPLVTVLGGMCYTLYLFHFQATWLVYRFSKHIVMTNAWSINLLLQSVIIGFVLLGVSICYFLAIEKPCMQKDWPARLANYVRSMLAGRGTNWALFGHSTDRVD